MKRLQFEQFERVVRRSMGFAVGRVILTLLLLTSCKSEFFVTGNIIRGRPLPKYDFAQIKIGALKENEITQSEAFVCARSRLGPKESPPEYLIELVGDPLVNCTIPDPAAASLSCSPGEKAGNKNWPSVLTICCYLGTERVCQDITLDVCDKNFDTTTHTLNTLEVTNLKPIFKVEYREKAPDPAHWEEFIAKIKDLTLSFEGFKDEQLKGIKAPVFVMAGDQDTIKLEEVVRMYRLFENAQLAIIPRGSHSWLTEKPKKFARMLDEFIHEGVGPETVN